MKGEERERGQQTQNLGAFPAILCISHLLLSTTFLTQNPTKTCKARMKLCASIKLSYKNKNVASQVRSWGRLVFPSKSNLLKSPLQLIFMDGRTGARKATGKPERSDESASELCWLWFGRAWNGSQQKVFPTFVYDVVVHQKIRSRAQLDRERQLDRHKT